MPLTIRIQDGPDLLDISFADVEKYHGQGSIAGAALAFMAMQAAFSSQFRITLRAVTNSPLSPAILAPVFAMPLNSSLVLCPAMPIEWTKDVFRRGGIHTALCRLRLQSVALKGGASTYP